MEGLIIRINLEGQLEGCKKHVSRQKHTTQLQKGEYITKVILHTDRNPTPCYKILRISTEILKIWKSNEVPEWMDMRLWRKMSPNQRVTSYVSGLDEGFGVSFEYVD